MDLFNNYVDQVIPFDKLKKIIVKMGLYRSVSISDKSTDWINQIKIQLLSAVDSFDSTTNTIFEMCSSSIPSTYIRLFDSPNPEMSTVQKSLLTNILTNVIEHLEKAQKGLSDTLNTFYSVHDKFKALLNQLKIDHDENGENFQDIVDGIVDQKSNFFSIFRMGEIEEEAISEVKEKIKPIRAFYVDASETAREILIKLAQTVPKSNRNWKTVIIRKKQVSESNEDSSKFQDAIKQSAQALIEKCQEYRHRHEKS